MLMIYLFCEYLFAPINNVTPFSSYTYCLSTKTLTLVLACYLLSIKSLCTHILTATCFLLLPSFDFFFSQVLMNEVKLTEAFCKTFTVDKFSVFLHPSPFVYYTVLPVEI